MSTPHRKSRHVQRHSLVDIDISELSKTFGNPVPRRSSKSSIRPLSTFHDELQNLQHITTSTFELIQRHARCWKDLPEEAKSGRGSEHDQLVNNTLSMVKSSYHSLLDLFPNKGDAPAIVDGHNRKTLSHRALSAFVRNFRIPISSTNRGTDTVAVALPNGALLGVVSISVATYYVLAPIDGSGGADQFRTDLLRTGAKTVLVLESDVKRLRLDREWVLEQGISVFAVKPEQDATFSLVPRGTAPRLLATRKAPNGPDDMCLILFTSGTSGTKKVVPFTLHSIVSSVAFVGESWGLGDQDICLNMMPLNHIGGLARNLFAPILLGGSTICCPAFDPNLFWDLVEERSPTWYYASPSMHSVILDEASNRTDCLRRSRIRMVCNAAGGLLPSLATRLRESFNCTVLPSYGMTECMPISTPHLDYALERPGTSGISTGPELCILNGTDEEMPSHAIGRVCVRGQPVFPGYLKDGKIDTSVFTPNGWFDTGDLGYMDEDGYLYITGRSKEVINRGGELISPFEIEEAIMTEAQTEASPLYGRVSECLAFSIPHSVLQEVVAIALVTPSGKPRADLRQLHESVKCSLHSTKWPVALVYMQALPKRNGKLCRVDLGARLDFETITDSMKVTERHFTATCPPPNTPISVPIKKHTTHVHQQKVVEAIASLYAGRVDVLTHLNSRTGLLDALVAPKSEHDLVEDLNSEFIKESLKGLLDGYLIPGRVNLNKSPFPRDDAGLVDALYARTVFATQARHRRQKSEKVASPLESKISSIYGTILNIPREDINSESSFFDLGGDSLRAGRLLSALRKEFSIRIPIDKLFSSPKVKDIHEIIEAYQLTAGKEAAQLTKQHVNNETYSSSSIPVLLVNLLPISFISPLKKAIFWIVFLKTWSLTLKYLQSPGTDSHVLFLFLSMLAARVIMSIVMPIVSITTKWLLIGRYREGLYPMWSGYHTKWWLVQKTIQMCGMGMFKHFNWSRVMFFRLLGAKIGNNVIIEPGTILGEYDLIELEDGVELDRCVVRPFGAEQSTTMYLGKIRMCKGSAAALKAIVAPGTTVPEDTCIGIQSSSWEWQDATESNFTQLNSRIPKPHWLVWFTVGLPIAGAIKLVSLLPWLAGLYGLNVVDPPEGADMFVFLAGWFANPTRVGYHFLARVLHLMLSPLVAFVLIILTKWILNLFFGKMKPSSTINRRHVDRFRFALFHELIPNGHLSEISGMFGTHYEITSKIIRLLGGKVGKRVYWPGHGPSIQDFDLINIGNDVVFGSRSHLITSDGIGSEYVGVADGAMVADRVVALPGSYIGEHAVLGSGTITRRDGSYAPESVYIGNKGGNPVCLSSGTTSSMPPTPLNMEEPASLWDEKASLMHTSELTTPSSSICGRSSGGSSPLLGHTKTPQTDSASPFGRAFYQKQASYPVYGLPTISAYSILLNIFISIYWNVPTVLSLQVLARVTHHSSTAHVFAPHFFRPFFVVLVLILSFSILETLFSVISLGICITAKWVLLGRRVQGNYDWDKSPYCQRWQILLTIERIRGSCLGGEGILPLLTGTAYLAAYYRLLGAQLGPDCALFAGGEMSLSFTEPDLLRLGERVAVDDASLVAHINSRGTFDLNPLEVGDRSVLRSGSRLLSGAVMGKDTCLLEHTLVMAGDDVEDGATCQGWPADGFTKQRVVIQDGGDEENEIKEQIIARENASDWKSWYGSLGKFWKGKNKGYQQIPRIEMQEVS